MENRTYRLLFEITGAQVQIPGRVLFVQEDAGTGSLQFSVRLNGEPYNMQGAVAEVCFELPDGTVVCGEAQITEAGEAVYTMGSTELACAGTVLMSFILHQNQKRLTVGQAPITVLASADTENAVDSGLVQPRITALLSQVNELETSVEETKAELQNGDFNGDSAYEVAVKNGFQGTESQWLASLSGKSPYIGANGNWQTYNADSAAMVDTGIAAAGNPMYNEASSLQEIAERTFEYFPRDMGMFDRIRYFPSYETETQITFMMAQSAAKVKLVGKNLLNPQNVVAGSVTTTGALMTSPASDFTVYEDGVSFSGIQGATVRTEYVPVRKGSLAFSLKFDSATAVMMKIYYYNTSKTFKSIVLNTSLSFTEYSSAVNIPDDGYIIMTVSSNISAQSTLHIKQWSLELSGGYATDFELYHEELIPVPSGAKSVTVSHPGWARYMIPVDITDFSSCKPRMPLGIILKSMMDRIAALEQAN